MTVALASVALISGCSSREMGTLDQVHIIKHRYVEDESADVVRIVGLARNTGELPTPEAELVATLRSRTGSFKGQNRVALPELEAGAEEQIALAVNSHGSVGTVEFEVVEPGTVVQGDEQQEEDAAEEDDGDGS